jgi:hypothetical protein
MKENKLTKTEIKYLKIVDSRDIRIRIPFKEKRPQFLIEPSIIRNL